MSGLSEKEMLNKLLRFNTPTVGNVVASYPEHAHCLGLYDPWKGRWYTDQSVRCMFPKMGRRIGYAVTMVLSLPDSEHPPVSYMDLIDALERSRKPSIVVCQELFPPEILDRAGLFGGQSATLYKACGVVGVIADGPLRDIDEVRALGVQHLMTGITSGHGNLAIRGVNVPVTVAGMDVAPGELVHMDENGACKFPADRLAEVCDDIDAFSQEEADHAQLLLAAKNITDLKAAWKKVISKGVGLDEPALK